MSDNFLDVREYDAKDADSICRIVSDLRNNDEATEISSKVSEIIEDVRRRGDKDLLRLTRKFDTKDILQVGDLEVTENETRKAFSKIDLASLNALKKATQQIRSFSKFQMSRFREIKFKSPLGFLITERYSPFNRIGGYVPGGLAAYPSTVLMICVTAKMAGVKEIVLASPPRIDGSLPDSVLVAASLGGATEIYKLGGAQAIAAMAVGTSLVRAVDLIVGPGNEYVTEAKKQVSSSENVLIDSLAGPTELLIVADEKANPEFIVEDLISQAEHGNRTICGLASTSQETIESVRQILSLMVGRPRGEYVARSIIFTIHVPSEDLLIAFSQKLAPEHLEVMVNKPERLAERLSNAGLLLLGDYSPCAASDYIVGTNHILPTGGFGKFYPGLGVERFLKRNTIIMGNKDSLYACSKFVTTLAMLEGFPNHASAPLIRFRKNKRRLNP
jgi:histidinol dehydrogenase